MWFVNTFFKKSLTNPHLASIDSLAKYTKSKPNRATKLRPQLALNSVPIGYINLPPEPPPGDIGI